MKKTNPEAKPAFITIRIPADSVIASDPTADGRCFLNAAKDGEAQRYVSVKGVLIDTDGTETEVSLKTVTLFTQGRKAQKSKAASAENSAAVESLADAVKAQGAMLAKLMERFEAETPLRTGRKGIAPPATSVIVKNGVNGHA